MLYDMLMCSALIRHHLILPLFSFSRPDLKPLSLSFSPTRSWIYSFTGYLSMGLFLPFAFFSASLAHCQSFNSASLLHSNFPAHSFIPDLLCSLTLCFYAFSSLQGYWFFCSEMTELSLSLSGPCVLWSSWRFLRTAATGPASSPPRHAPIWPRSWRSTPRCPSIMQASTCRCSASACSPQRCTPAKLHPKPSNVSRISHGLQTLCISHPLLCRDVCKWSVMWIIPLNAPVQGDLLP